MSSFYSKNIKYIISFFVIILLISCLIPSNNYSSINSEIRNGKNIIGNNNVVIDNYFKVSENYNKMGILLSSKQQYISKGKIFISLYEDDKLKKTFKINSNQIVDDNYYFKYYYLNYKIRKNKNYKIKITFKNLSSKILLRTTKDKKFNDSLFVDEKKNNNVLALSFLKKNKSYFNTWYFSLITLMLISFKILFNKENNYE